MKNNMYLVNASALPQVFRRVVEAKRLLASGQVKTASEASKRCRISRSAYYKYKDSVFEYAHPLGEIITINAVLHDKAGVLSAFLLELYSAGCNLLTVNQGLPSSGTALVSVSLRISPTETDVKAMLTALKNIDGVISVKKMLES